MREVAVCPSGPIEPRDEDVAAGDLASLSRQLDRCGVDLLELVLQEVLAQLRAVGAERVRLDQLGSRGDEADVQRDDCLRRAQVRLLGTPQPWDGRADERAHPAVGHDRRPVPQAFDEPLAHAHAGQSRAVVDRLRR